MQARCFHSAPSLLFGLLVLACIVVPVYGDVVIPTNTYVYFEQNGQPYNGSVQYTVNCFGSVAYPGEPASYYPDLVASPNDEIVFSFSATCPHYGCVVYNPYYLNYLHIDRCELIGKTDTYSFSIPAFSDTPVPQNCTSFQQFDIATGDNEYYNTTPAYDDCRNSSGPGLQCDRFLTRIDPSSLVMYIDQRTGETWPAEYICKQHFTIPPPDTGTGIVPAQHPGNTRMGPIEMLYCGILSSFGSTC